MFLERTKSNIMKTSIATILLVGLLLLACNDKKATSKNKTNDLVVNKNTSTKPDTNEKERKIKPAFSGQLTPPKTVAKKYTFPWIANYDAKDMLTNRILPPAPYQRKKAPANSFSEWLRHLPLKTGKPEVMLYNGQRKGNQSAHYAVVNMDVGKRDLQQCADAVMRLRAEYLYGTKQANKIHFNFTSGDNIPYSKWKDGYRISLNKNKVKWNKTKGLDASYATFKKYLIQIFNYAGTFSLSKELKPVGNIKDLAAGDVFIQGGFPGHAVIVVDVAQHPQTGEKLFLLAQSYMPAQETHILKNPNNSDLSPWYSTNFEGDLHTPEWTFGKGDLKRFGE